MRVYWTTACAIVVGLFGIVVAPVPARAWGKFSYLTVCDLAYRNLPPARRDALGDLLQSRTGGITVSGRGQMPDRHYAKAKVSDLTVDEKKAVATFAAEIRATVD